MIKKKYTIEIEATNDIDCDTLANSLLKHSYIVGISEIITINLNNKVNVCPICQMDNGTPHGNQKVCPSCFVYYPA